MLVSQVLQEMLHHGPSLPHAIRLGMGDPYSVFEVSASARPLTFDPGLCLNRRAVTPRRCVRSWS